jgi:eukaryotic-like serine/threonine-protein kinase
MDEAGVDVGLRSFEVPEAGQILESRYDLVSWVGEGTFGEVWKAIDLRTGITVAVKLAKNSGADDRFAEESKLLARLQHPGVVPLRDQWDASSPEARPFFVMDYCESNLKKWIAEMTNQGTGFSPRKP